jgi:hypothetical protein
MKKNLLPLFLFASLSLAAGNTNQSCLEKPKTPICCPEKPILCPEQPRSKVENCRSYNIALFGEYLFWKFTSPFLPFGRDGVGLTNAASPTEIEVSNSGTSYSPDYQYDSGFRLGIGVLFGEKKAFDLALRYTWFYTNPERTVEPTSPFVALNWMVAPSLTSPVFSRASSQLNLHYNCPEIQFGYTFRVNNYLALRPYIALTSIIIDGELHINYQYTATTGVFEIDDLRDESFSWAIGPKMGLDFTARPWDHFSVYCGFNITQQAAHIEMQSRQTATRPILGTQINTQLGQLTQVRSVPLFGFELGPVWDQWFANNQYHTQLRVVWQLSTLGGGNLSFLNNNNVDIPIGAELRGVNVRALFEF